jgi:hypothetical protein
MHYQIVCNVNLQGIEGMQGPFAPALHKASCYGIARVTVLADHCCRVRRARLFIHWRVAQVCQIFGSIVKPKSSQRRRSIMIALTTSVSGLG